MIWNIKKVSYYGDGDTYTPDYEVTKEVKDLLKNGWQPFAMTYEDGEIGTYPWIWMKKQFNKLKYVE